MQLRTIMSQPVISCRPGDTLNTAARLMWEHDCGSLPVLDDDERAVGMITDRDICMAGYTRGRLLSELIVGDTMARDVVTCHVVDSLETAERVMSDAKVRRVPVVDHSNRVIGIVSLSDMARFTLSSKRGNQDRRLTSTLASISEPRVQKDEEYEPHEAFGE